jgi:hypothetical protein
VHRAWRGARRLLPCSARHATLRLLPCSARHATLRLLPRYGRTRHAHATIHPPIRSGHEQLGTLRLPPLRLLRRVAPTRPPHPPPSMLHRTGSPVARRRQVPPVVRGLTKEAGQCVSWQLDEGSLSVCVMAGTPWQRAECHRRCAPWQRVAGGSSGSPCCDGPTCMVVHGACACACG